jgi:hypothetical protein
VNVVPLPKDFSDLLHPPVGPLYPRGWEDEFGPYSWCYVAGFLEACLKLGLRNDRLGRTALNRLKADAIRHLPPQWRSAFIDPDPRRQGWDQFDASKFFRKALRNEAMRLDKALLTVVALDLYATGPNGIEGFDVVEHISIRPAIFKIDEYSPEKYGNRIKPLFINNQEFTNSLKGHTLQPTTVVFRLMAEGETTTFKTSELTRSFFETNADLIRAGRMGLGPVVAISGRPADKKKCPAHCEFVTNA